jgi:hypothetical protein
MRHSGVPIQKVFLTKYSNDSFLAQNEKQLETGKIKLRA